MPKFTFEGKKTYFYSGTIEADSIEEAEEELEHTIEDYTEDFGPEVDIDCIWEAV